MLLLFGLVLFFNVSGASAATATQTVSHTTTGTTLVKATQVNPKVIFTSNQIGAASSKIKSYYETNHKLPSYVTINKHKVTMPQFLQLLSDDIIQLNTKKSTSVTLRKVAAPTKPVESMKTGNLIKTQYINLVKNTKTYIYTTGKAPNNINTPLGKIKYQNLVYIFSKIAYFQKINNRLPNYVSVKPSATYTASHATSPRIQSIVDYIGYTEAKFRDIQGQSSPSVMERVGYGDCWADSGWLYNKLSAAGIPVRIIGHTSGAYPLHRWVDINTGNGWQEWDYAKYHSQHHPATGSGYYVVKSSV